MEISTGNADKNLREHAKMIKQKEKATQEK